MVVRIPVEVALENLWELLWGNNEKPCKQKRGAREGLVGKPAYETGRQAEDPAAVCMAYYWLLEDPCGHVHCRVSWIFIRACMGLPPAPHSPLAGAMLYNNQPVFRVSL